MGSTTNLHNSSQIETGMVPQLADYFLDITTDRCPITFVKAKLLVERMQPGQTAEIRLNAGEPLENVPRALSELGHTVEPLGAEAQTPTVHRLRVRKR
ncbi:MAG: sulfurtransferase TusA family protein [Alphaproteobacteria bacterium]